MAIKSKITLTFTEELPLNAVVSFEMRAQIDNLSIDNTFVITETVKAARTNQFEMAIASSSSAVVGENTAMNYYDALLLDYGVNPFLQSVYNSVTRNANVVTIDVNSSIDTPTALEQTFSLGSISSHASVTIVIDNNYTVTENPDPAPSEDETLVFSEIPLDYVTIEIVDTYVNDRVLIVEKTQLDYCELRYDAGDNFETQLKISSLIFNMLVEDNADAAYLHLFTGDEKRYKVEVYYCDVDDNKNLFWQGFLIPDVYSEPYTNRAMFPSFEAIDNLKTLENYNLPSYYYNNRFPLPKLLAYLLEPTGLNQKIVIAPSLIPAATNDLRYINIPLGQYYNDGDLENNYTILEDVLKSLALTIYNFRGYWFVVGLNRMGDEVVNHCSVYDVNGEFEEYARIERKVSTFFSEDSVNLFAVAPISKIEFDLNKDNRLNVFPENIVNPEFFSTCFFSYGGFRDWFIGETVFANTLVKNWNKVGSELYRRFEINQSKFIYYITDTDEASYNVNEATALSNYFTPTETFYVVADLEYKLKLKLKVDFEAAALPTNTDYEPYDAAVPFQILVNGVEVYAYRPSVVVDGKKKYSRNLNEIVGGFSISFTLEDELYFVDSGVMQVRLLMPIWNNTTGVVAKYIHVEELELLEQQQEDYLEFVSATRGTKNTIKYSEKLPFVSSSNVAIKNNIGIGLPVLNNYDRAVTSLSAGVDYIGEHAFADGPTADAVIKEITLKQVDSTEVELIELFKNDKRLNCFIRNSVTGEEKAFTSLYGHLFKNLVTNVVTAKLGYLFDFERGVKLPKGYKKYQESLNGWDLFYKDVQYSNEVIANRDNWNVVNGTLTDTFLKQLTRIYFGMYNKILFRLECTQYELLQPDGLIAFDYNGSEKLFSLNSFSLVLTAGKTKITAALENDFAQDLTNIIFE